MLSELLFLQGFLCLYSDKYTTILGVFFFILFNLIVSTEVTALGESSSQLPVLPSSQKCYFYSAVGGSTC